MKEYLKPNISIITLEAKENIANVIPTVTDPEQPETSIPHIWGDEYWD